MHITFRFVPFSANIHTFCMTVCVQIHLSACIQNVDIYFDNYSGLITIDLHCYHVKIERKEEWEIRCVVLLRKNIYSRSNQDHTSAILQIIKLFIDLEN